MFGRSLRSRLDESVAVFEVVAAKAEDLAAALPHLGPTVGAVEGVFVNHLSPPISTRFVPSDSVVEITIVHCVLLSPSVRVFQQVAPLPDVRPLVEQGILQDEQGILGVELDGPTDPVLGCYGDVL